MADPKIKYDIEANVSGNAEVGQLATRIEQLAGTLDGELKTSALASADALRQLAQKDGAVQNFIDLKREAIQAATGLKEAQAAAQKLGAELSDVENPTRKQVGAMQKLRDAVRDAKTEVLDSSSALVAARGSLEQYGVSTKNLTQTQRDIKTSINAARTEVVDMASAWQSAASEQAAAAKEMAESDRLLAIEAKGMAELYERGRVALLAEEAGLREAARASVTYKAAREAEEQTRRDASALWQREAEAIVEASIAAQKLKREVDVLTAAERDLANTKVFAQQAEDAKKLQQAGEYVKFWESELAKVETQLNETAAASEKSAQEISNAFHTIGVKSAQELESEIVQVRLAMDDLKNKAGLTGSTLNSAFAAGEAKIKGLERQIREVNGTLTLGDKAANLFRSSLGQMSAGNVIADGVGYLVNKVKELGAAFLGAIVQGDQLKRGLNAVYKDAAITAQQIDFLRKASSESGVAFGSLSGEFVKFTASMKMANIPMAQSNELFKAVTAASASLGLGAEATAGTLNALGQMASKGTVSMEELRAQLGDRLPGALSLTAQGLGITEGQLIKLVESGQLATRDFVVPFTQALGQLRGEVDGLTPSWERLKGMMTETAQGAGDSGWTQVLNLGIKVLGGTVGVFLLGLSGLSEALFLVVKGIAALALALTSPKAAMELMSDAVEAARLRLTGQAAALNNLIEPSAAAAAATTTHAAALTANTAAVTKSIAANTQLDSAQKLAALSVALAGDATLDAGAKIVQYNVAATELFKSQSGQTDAFNKLSKAAKEQGATLVENAKLTGDNTAIQIAGLQAAQLHAAAIDKAAASQATETAILVAQKTELEKSAAARGLTALQIKTQSDELDKLILSSKAETEQSLQAQAAARADVEARKLAVAVLKDHSGAVAELKLVMDVAAATLKEYEIRAINGKKTEAEVEEARKALTRATVLYKDSLGDLITKTEMAAKVKSADMQLSIAQSEASAKHYLALAAEARALGNTTLAAQLEIKAKENQIKTMQLKLQLDKLQQDAALLEIPLKRKLIDETTAEGKIKLQLLDIETQMIKIKQVGNQAAQDAIRAVEKETQALRNGINTRKESTDGINTDTGVRNRNTNSVETQTGALERQNSELLKQKAAMDALNAATSAPNGGVVKSALTKDDMKGVDNTGLHTLQNKRATGTLGKDDLATAQAVFDAAATNMDVYAKNWGAFSMEGQKSIQDTYNQSRAILEQVRGLGAAAGVTSTSRTNTTAAAVPVAKTYTVNIVENGQSRQYSASSDADAQALIKLLQNSKLSSGL